MKLDGKNKHKFRCVIDILETNPLSLGGWGDFQCFVEFGASGCAGTMKIGRHVRNLHKLT